MTLTYYLTSWSSNVKASFHNQTSNEFQNKAVGMEQNVMWLLHGFLEQKVFHTSKEVFLETVGSLFLLLFYHVIY